MTDEAERDPRDIAAEETSELLQEWRDSGKRWQEFLTGLYSDEERTERRLRCGIRANASFETAGGQLPLPGIVPEPKRARAPRRVLMHVGIVDGLHSFVCPKCDASESIPEGMTEAAKDRGIPCPKCNATEAST